MTEREVQMFEVAGALDAARFVFAKTLAWNPHWYTVRNGWPAPAAFERAVRVVDGGRAELFRGHTYRVQDFNGYAYWTMGKGARESKLINRRRSWYPTAFDEVAGEWADGTREGAMAVERAAVREVLRPAIENVERAAGRRARVLDVGCCTGTLLDAFGTVSAPHLIDPTGYCGVDASQTALIALAASHPAYARGVLRCGTADLWPVVGRYDVLTSILSPTAWLRPSHLERLAERVDAWAVTALQGEYWPEVDRLGVTIPVTALASWMADHAERTATVGRHVLYTKGLTW